MKPIVLGRGGSQRRQQPRGRLTAVVKRFKHSYGGYTRGCKCPVCTDAKREYMSRRRTAAVAQAQQYAAATGERYIAPGVPHGKRHSYEEHGCRCESCTRVHSLSRRPDTA